MTKVSEYAGDGKRTPILVALIGAAAVIIVGYWQYYSKPEKKEFIGRVIEAKTEKRIRNAKVSLEVQGVPPVIYTDSEGIFSFSLKDADNQVRVRVEAEGYEKFDRLITLSTRTGVEEIQLSLAQPNSQSDSGKTKDKLRPSMIFDQRETTMDNNGALDYIEKIKVNTVNISNSDVIQSIVIHPKMYLETIPLLEPQPGAGYAITSEERGKKFEIIYNLKEVGFYRTEFNPKFRLEIRNPPLINGRK
jgi:hypothetical protein